MKKIGFIGLGVMGIQIAQNLMDKGYHLKIWNRSKKKYSKIKGDNFTTAISPADCAKDTDIIFFSLSNSKAIKDVLFNDYGLYSGVKKGQIVVNLSTAEPSNCKQESAQFLLKDVNYLDAPVFGSEEEAKNSKLCVIVGGNKSSYQDIKHILHCFCEYSYYMGGSGKGATMGLIGSLIVLHQSYATAEAILMAKKAEIDIKTAFEIIGLSDFRSPILEVIGKNYIDNKFQPVFSLEHLKKDSDQILTLARELGVTLKGAELVNTILEEGINEEIVKENFSSIVKLI